MVRKKSGKDKNLRVDIGGLKLKNPVIVASGTFGYGEEMAGFFDINKLGAIVTKTITLKPREGNPTPRIAETPSGMLNSIGLENKGLADFMYNKVQFLEGLKTPVIVSIAGDTIEEFCKLSEELSRLKCVSGIELNLSCPNVRHNLEPAGCKLVAQDKTATEKVVSEVRKNTKLTLITKLSPNVTDIKEIARAAEGAGTDAISAVNTLFGLSIDINTKKAKLGNGAGGLSGPAIKPVALNFVREIYSAVKIPVIGIGGIMTPSDALEFIICGATAIQVGTANFVNPTISLDVLQGIKAYATSKKLKDITSLIGTADI